MLLLKANVTLNWSKITVVTFIKTVAHFKVYSYVLLILFAGTVRRFLERYGTDIDAVVFVCDEESFVSS